MKVIYYMVFVVIVLSLYASPALAANGEPVVVEAEGLVTLGDDSTICHAKAAALNNARRAALEKVTGVEVRGATMVYNYQLINDLVVTATKGVIVKEKIIENGCRSKDEQLFCTARIEANIMPLHVERRGDFAVIQVEVHRPDRKEAIKSPVFQNFDEIHVHAAANQDAFLNIFSVDQYGGISKLYPNEFVGHQKTPAGKELIFPEDSQRQNGIKMKVKTSKATKKSVESVLVVATKEQVELIKDKTIENPTITDLMKELSDIAPSLWAEKAVGYEVRE